MRRSLFSVSCVLMFLIAGCTSASTRHDPHYLPHCYICGGDAIADGVCTKCGVMAYEPRSYTADEENAAADRALEKLATVPKGWEVFISSSPIQKPSWVTAGINQIEQAVGVPVKTSFSGNRSFEDEARKWARVEPETMWPGGPFNAVGWYIERSVTATEAGIVTIYRAWALWFGEKKER